MNLFERFVYFLSRKRRQIQYKKMYDEFVTCRNHLKLIEDDYVKLWQYIDSQEVGSLGWIMTRQYRIDRAHQLEQLRKQHEINAYVEMNNRIKIIKEC